MSIEWFRDLVIIIWGLGSTVVIIIIGVLAIMFYRRMRPALDSLKTTTKTVESITSVVSENVVGPLSKVVAFVQGARQAINLVSQLRNKKEED
ncbi:MAG TPA: hypothetical protein G4O16_06800 [Dehalococcoidia bacterium]|nr:hypothetical protein [Dehalococcoidia bacterium]